VSPLLPIAAESHEDDDLPWHLRSGMFGGENQQAVCLRPEPGAS
jgi:hypothetical protein